MFRFQVTVFSNQENSFKFRLTVCTNNIAGKNNYSLYRFNVTLIQHELFRLSKDNTRRPAPVGS
jgi:hypothetical protein